MRAGWRLPVGLTLADDLLIPIRFPRLFPDLLATHAPGVWLGEATAALAAGRPGSWWGPLLPSPGGAPAAC